jgi:hypothetical protein
MTAPKVEAARAPWSAEEAVDLAHRAGFSGTCWTVGPEELAHMLNMVNAQPPTPTLPVEVHGKWYDVPIPVQVRMVALEDERDAFKTAMHEEIAENLRLRELGGAHDDENMVAFIERLIREATPQAPAVAVPVALGSLLDNYGRCFHAAKLENGRRGTEERANDARKALVSAFRATPQPPAQPQAQGDALMPAFDDPRVQIVYELLCSEEAPLNKQEHWEGWVARKIVAALSAPPPAQAAEQKFVVLGFLREPFTREIVDTPTQWPVYAPIAASPSPAASAEGKKSGAPSVRSRDEG